MFLPHVFACLNVKMNVYKKVVGLQLGQAMITKVIKMVLAAHLLKFATDGSARKTQEGS